MLLGIVGGRLPCLVAGGQWWCDVRDVAAAISRAVGHLAYYSPRLAGAATGRRRSGACHRRRYAERVVRSLAEPQAQRRGRRLRDAGGRTLRPGVLPQPARRDSGVGRVRSAHLVAARLGVRHVDHRQSGAACTMAPRLVPEDLCRLQQQGDEQHAALRRRKAVFARTGQPAFSCADRAGRITPRRRPPRQDREGSSGGEQPVTVRQELLGVQVLDRGQYPSEQLSRLVNEFTRILSRAELERVRDRIELVKSLNPYCAAASRR